MSQPAGSPVLGAMEPHQRDALAVAFGLKEEPPDPARLTRQVAEANERSAAASDEARLAQVELAAARNASQYGADPDRLLDSRAFLAAIGQLDPAAGDFGDRLGDAIRSASPGVQPREQDQGDSHRQWSAEDVERARAEDPALIFEAQQRGQLRDLGYVPTGEGLGPNFDPQYASDKYVQRQQRRRQLTADYGGGDGRSITAQDVKDAAPSVALEWIHAGKLAHLGVPAQRRRGQR